ncbi:MAG: rod shape-determining protein MreC [Clostridiales bacterium]|nr:rod shape-determining protein MreC [Clostridiales bacterium]
MPKKAKPAQRKTAAPRTGRRRWLVTLRNVLLSILIIAVVAATVFLLVLRTGDQVSFVENSIGSLLSPVQSALSQGTNSLRTFIINQRNYGKLEQAYLDLSRQNDQLTMQLNAAEEAMLENERLRTLLDAKNSYDALDPVYARVIARDAGQWFSTFSINKGTMHGVTKDMAVVTGDGLVGCVYEVGLNYANVRTIIDSRSGLGCLVQRTRDEGILRGGTSDSDDDATCTLNYLPHINSVTPGDVVVTSGTDSVYPKGLAIGTVTQVSLSAGADGNYAIVSPYADFLHIEEVLVLRDVVEKADGDLAALPTPTPAPTASPSPEPDPDALTAPDDQAEEIFTYPSGDDAQATEAPNVRIEPLPEDAWAEN